jgi:hypothetical protein
MHGGISVLYHLIQLCASSKSGCLVVPQLQLHMGRMRCEILMIRVCCIAGAGALQR